MTAVAGLLPVLPADRFFLLFEGFGAPATGGIAFVLKGAEMERERFTRAVRSTFERHPRAASRLLRVRAGLRTRLYWDPVPEAAERACFFHEPDAATPVERVAAVLNSPLDLREGPGTQFHWMPGLDGSALLACRAHHALGDGRAWMTVLGDLFAAYNGTAPSPAPPVSLMPPAPMVEGTPGSKLRMLLRLFAYHFRQSRAYRFAPPEKLFDIRRPPGRTIGVCSRNIAPGMFRRCLAGAKAAGISLNDLLIAAHGAAIERWKAEKGEACGTLRLSINKDLRHKDRAYPEFETRSSAFPVWVGPDDRKNGKALLQRIHQQVQACHDQSVAEATALLGVFLRLPLGLARLLVLPAATRPKIADSLVISNFGRLPSAPAGAVQPFSLGTAEILDAFPFVRPPEGVGALSFALSLPQSLCLSFSFLTGLFETSDLQRLLELIELALEELTA